MLERTAGSEAIRHAEVTYGDRLLQLGARANALRAGLAGAEGGAAPWAEGDQLIEDAVLALDGFGI